MPHKRWLVPLSLLLLVMQIGCTPQRQVDPTLNTTLPSNTAVQPPSTTVATDTTEEMTYPTQPEETTPPTTESTQPSEPTETDPVVTQPTETVPPVTEPAGQEKPTEPATTVHQHNYHTEVVSATCETAGYTVHTCSCGDRYTDSQTPATGHAYVETVTAPTMWKQGYTTFLCSNCSDSYTDNYTNMTEAEKEAFIQEVRDATLKHINQFRSVPAESLPGLTQVANYRAVQLHTNFAHSTKDLREALAYYQYGEYKTPAGWDPSEYYYDFPGREAISRTSKTGNADEIGKRFAQNFYNSSGHWAYVGSNDYSYIAVGISYNAASMGGYCWTCCVFVTDTNQYG